MKLGIHKARIVDYALTETKAGLPQVSIRFEFEDQQMNWYGSLKTGKPAEITMEALRECGFTGSTIEDLEKLNAGPDAEILDTINTVDITVENQLDGMGNVKPKITRIGKTGFKRLDVKEASKKLENLGLEELLSKFPPKKRKPVKKENPSDEIPF